MQIHSTLSKPLILAAACALAWALLETRHHELDSAESQVRIDVPKAAEAPCSGECDEGYQWAQLHGVTLDRECQGHDQTEEFRRGCRLLLQDAREAQEIEFLNAVGA